MKVTWAEDSWQISEKGTFEKKILKKARIRKSLLWGNKTFLGLTSWFNVENAWFFFPFYLVLTVVVVMAIILGHLIIFGDYETEKSENPGYNKVEL